MLNAERLTRDLTALGVMRLAFGFFYVILFDRASTPETYCYAQSYTPRYSRTMPRKLAADDTQ
jgi:hypothetical protein